MNRKWCIAVVVGSLLSVGCAGPAGRPRATVYPKTRILGCSCTAAWPDLLGVVGDAGFRLVAKDDTGHIARFLYLEPQLPEIVRSGEGSDNLALAADGSSQESAKLRIESAVLALSQLEQGCEARISVSYQVRNGVWGSDWSNRESSGLLENRVLSAVHVADEPNVERNRRVALRRPNRNLAPAAGLAAKPQVSIIGGADAPHTEYTPDAAYDLAHQ